MFEAMFLQSTLFYYAFQIRNKLMVYYNSDPEPLIGQICDKSTQTMLLKEFEINLLMNIDDSS